MMKRIDIGAYSAYAIAVKHGYKGTEEEWNAEQERNRIASEDAANKAKEIGSTVAQIALALPFGNFIQLASVFLHISVLLP